MKRERRRPLLRRAAPAVVRDMIKLIGLDPVTPRPPGCYAEIARKQRGL